MSFTLFSSESVTEGHPDKLCDQISDSILDALLVQDADSRVACETATTTGTVWVFGEVHTAGYVDIEKIVRKTISEIGYSGPAFGFDAQSCGVLNSIAEQSPDIAQGVDRSKEIDPYERVGAGDQGMVFGFACDETELELRDNGASIASGQFMPAPLALAHKLTRQLANVRKANVLPWLGPDGKSQVTVAYENGVPSYLDTILISAQHLPDISLPDLREAVIEEVIKPVCPTELQTGLTGRKIIVDTYGGAARHGGGAFSGKDPSKVDRSAAYAARHVAKNFVAAGLARRLELQISYAIGIARPVSVMVDSFGTGIMSDSELADVVQRHFDLRPAAIIERFDLRRPIYKQTASYGHFGRDDIDLPWERLDEVEVLKALR